VHDKLCWSDSLCVLSWFFEYTRQVPRSSSPRLQISHYCKASVAYTPPRAMGLHRYHSLSSDRQYNTPRRLSNYSPDRSICDFMWRCGISWRCYVDDAALERILLHNAQHVYHISCCILCVLKPDTIICIGGNRLVWLSVLVTLFSRYHGIQRSKDVRTSHDIALYTIFLSYSI